MSGIFIVTSEYQCENTGLINHKIEGVRSTFELAHDLRRSLERSDKLMTVEVQFFPIDEEY
jgi:hypothetical protein